MSQRPIYACDRCGHWYTTDQRFATDDIPWEDGEETFRDAKMRDFCKECTAALNVLAQEISILEDWEAAVDRWVNEGKGAEVKPRSLKR